MLQTIITAGLVALTAAAPVAAHTPDAASPAPAEVGQSGVKTRLYADSCILRSVKPVEILERRAYVENSFSFEWPVEVNGRTDLKVLHDALLAHTFGHAGESLENAKNRFLVTRPMGADDTDELEKVASIPEDDLGPNCEENHFAITIMEGCKLPTFQIYNYIYTGGAHGMYSFGYVTYDPAKNRVLSLADIVPPSHRKVVLGKLNAAIAREAKLEDKQLSQVEELPDNFYLTDKGITFVFQPYEIASYADGVIYIDVAL